MKRALSLRAKTARNARRYTQLLANALRLSQDAAAQLNELNQLYNVDVSTQTLLVYDLLDVLQPEQLTGVLGQSTPGEEEQLSNLIPDSNDGQPLPESPLFGEVAAGTPIILPVQTAKALASEATAAPNGFAAQTHPVELEAAA